jgi:hypothetical protein
MKIPSRIKVKWLFLDELFRVAGDDAAVQSDEKAAN